MSELENCCGTTCNKAALAEEIAQLRQAAADRNKEAELAKHAANELLHKNAELAAQVEHWKAISGKHLSVASDLINDNRRLLLKTFIAGCDAGYRYGDNPFERDRQFDNFISDLREGDSDQYLAEHDREVAALAVEEFKERYNLPCSVFMDPSTKIGAGVSLNVLLRSMELRQQNQIR